MLALGPPYGYCATNAVLGGIGGINNGTLSGGDGTGTATIDLNSVTLAVVKQARDISGIVLPGGANVASGQEIYFVIYVDNTTNFSAYDLRITDSINEAEFTYVTDSIEFSQSPTGSNNAAIWAAAWSSATDAVGAPDDLASITDSGGIPGLERVTAGNVTGQVNLQLNIPSLTIAAFRFRVLVN
jgi:hypothetical protein